MLTVAYSDGYLDWQLGAEHPTNPVRAKNAVRLIEDALGPEGYREVKWCAPERWAEAACQVHDPYYVQRILYGYSSEWDGKNEVLGRTALRMFGGTVELVEELLADRSADSVGVYFNPQGAKHHAHYARSSGFCVFNDMAWAAERLTREGLRVAYVDWDAHHGDGVEFMLREREDIWTFSIHDGTIFPGTGFGSGPGFWNAALPEGAGDIELLKAFSSVLEQLEELKPDIVLLACGADGLAHDPLSSLLFTHGGLAKCAKQLGEFVARTGASVLVGGAGGYQPHDETPRHWAETVLLLTEAIAGV